MASIDAMVGVASARPHPPSPLLVVSASIKAADVGALLTPLVRVLARQAAREARQIPLEKIPND